MEIDVGRAAGTIPPLLFGHNLEHTRSCVWRGLSAQLIRNRKFAGPPSPKGVAPNWYPVESGQCWHMLERSSGIKGTAGAAYTAHFDPALNHEGSAGQRQRIQQFGRAEPCGIGQDGVFLIEGKEYEGRLALLSDRAIPVRVRLAGRDAEEVLSGETVTVKPGRWTEHEFAFVAPENDTNARLEITFEQPGTLYVGAASLLPADAFHGMRRDVIELLKEMSVPLLRWPGGNFAGCYRWKDALMPADRRPPLWGEGILPHTGGYDDHEIGTDGFIALCRELDAEPSVTINMGLEGPEEAAAWVEYCNGGQDTEWGGRRAERGHPDPYDVKYWSLGNEMGYGHMKGPNTPREYGEMAAACAGAMREVDPSIVLIASGTWWKDEWYEGVLAEVGDSFDHIAYHQYTDFMKDFDGEHTPREFERVASHPDDVLSALGRVRTLADRHAPGGKFVGISFDEWNVWHAWFRRPGIVEGIHAASMLNMLCREAERVGITMGAYFEPVNEGAILVEPDSARLTPAGRVFSLYRAHHGNQLVPVDAGEEAEGPDVAASVDPQKKQVTLTLVNRSCVREAEAHLTLKNVQRPEVLDAVCLTSPGFLPGATFEAEDLDVTLSNSHTLCVTIPKHSVARVRVKYG